MDAAIAQVAATKHSVLGTEVALQTALADLKQVAARQAEQGAKQVKNIAERQQQVVDRVDARVGSALWWIGGISSVIVLVAAVLGLLTVRVITRRLDAAVRVAEAVSAGRLDAVPVVQGHDETARLMAALGSMVQTLRRMLVHIHQASTAIQAGSQRIAEIVGVIDGIAFQTNILALNAAVEAARAGEHGRGFAVVASAVRALAGKSAQAAQQVKAILNASVERVQDGTGQVRDTGNTIGSVVTRVQEVSALIQTISGASQSQTSALVEVSDAIVQIDEMTQKHAALAELGTAASMSLHRQAEGLMQAVAVFKVTGR